MARKLGSISRVENGAVVSIYPFQHNPNNLTRTRKTKWVALEAPGTTGSMAEFVNVGEWSMTLKLMLSSWSVNSSFSRNGVQPHISEIESWGLPSLDVFMTDDSHYISPPILRFQWGSRKWDVHCTSIEIEETEWNEDLMPTSATATISLETHTDNFLQLQSMMADVMRRRNELNVYSLGNGDIV